ncbi:hypothetical protein O181_006569 [Austropuccinia psidii MF-1]|uniref:Uncharacterized protein n=1 Tax=Austropuccinia psidii MF-1 TaxID=1389203 RepID=A0A9Q3GH06_9BASI|nr:hypothetical protein [Austropuccinia psidii MF-1]
MLLSSQNPEEAINPKKYSDGSLSDKAFNTNTWTKSVNKEVEDWDESIDLEAPSPDHSEAEDGWYYEPGEYSYEDDEED